MSKFKRNFWMTTLLSGAMAFAAGPAFAQAPVIPSTSQQLDPNMPKHGMEQMQKEGKLGTSASAKNQGISSMGKLHQADAHTLWLLHKIDQNEIAAAQLAQAKSQNDKVKSLADDLLNDHKKLDDQVMKIAQDNNVQFEGTDTGTGGAGLSGQSSSKSSSDQDQQSQSQSTATEDQSGTGGSGQTGTPGTTTGSTKMNGDHAPAGPSDQGAQQGGKDVSKTGGSSTVQEIPNSGTGGSASAGTQAQGTATGTEAQGSATAGGAGVSGQAGTTGTGASATATAETPKSAGQPMKLSSTDKSFLEKGSAQLQKLSKLQGSKFDREFLHAQIRDHQHAMKLLHSANPQNSDVKSLLADAMSGMQKHEKAAREALHSLSGVGGGGQAGTSSARPNVPSYAPNQTSGATTGSSQENAADQNAAITGAQKNGESQSGSATGEGAGAGGAAEGTGGSSNTASGSGGGSGGGGR